jgi:O-antigen ligase
MVKRTFSLADLAITGFIVITVTPTLNRTTLAVVVLCLIGIFVSKIIVDGRRLYFTLVITIVLAALVPVAIPADSPLMRRIQGTIEYDPEETHGSIGERQAEFLAINDKLRRMGAAAEWFGAGHGALYYVELAVREVPEAGIGHAHFGWSLFKLRYGYVGYLYLLILCGMALRSIVRNYRSPYDADRVISVLAMFSVMYIFTYVLGLFFIAGTQFSSARAAMAEPQPTRKISHRSRPHAVPAQERPVS